MTDSVPEEWVQRLLGIPVRPSVLARGLEKNLFLFAGLPGLAAGLLKQARPVDGAEVKQL